MKDMAYPGYFVIDHDGLVTAKYFEEIYSDRRTPNSVFGQLFPELMERGAATVRSPHLSVRAGQSDLVAAPGNRVTLFLDIELTPGTHVYAPGVRHYRQLELRLDAPAPFEVRPAVLPASRVLELPAIKERVPVFESRFRVSQDLIVPGRSRDFLMTLRDAPDGARKTTIPGTLRYQACDAKRCYPSAELPVSWTLTVRSWKMIKKEPGE